MYKGESGGGVFFSHTHWMIISKRGRTILNTIIEREAVGTSAPKSEYAPPQKNENR